MNEMNTNKTEPVKRDTYVDLFNGMMKMAREAGALAEFDALPDAARQAGATFGEKLKSRAEVLGTVDRLVASALKPA